MILRGSKPTLPLRLEGGESFSTAEVSDVLTAFFVMENSSNGDLIERVDKLLCRFRSTLEEVALVVGGVPHLDDNGGLAITEPSTASFCDRASHREMLFDGVFDHGNNVLGIDHEAMFRGPLADPKRGFLRLRAKAGTDVEFCCADTHI